MNSSSKSGQETIGALLLVVVIILFSWYRSDQASRRQSQERADCISIATNAFPPNSTEPCNSMSGSELDKWYPLGK